MEPLFERDGRVVAWYQDPALLDRAGRYIGFNKDSDLFSYGGRYLGTMHDGVLRDRNGQVVAFLAGADGEGLTLPNPEGAPAPPVAPHPPGSPLVPPVAERAVAVASWSERGWDGFVAR
jgi:hypothetical protein